MEMDSLIAQFHLKETPGMFNVLTAESDVAGNQLMLMEILFDMF